MRCPRNSTHEPSLWRVQRDQRVCCARTGAIASDALPVSRVSRTNAAASRASELPHHQRHIPKPLVPHAYDCLQPYTDRQPTHKESVLARCTRGGEARRHAKCRAQTAASRNAGDRNLRMDSTSFGKAAPVVLAGGPGGHGDAQRREALHGAQLGLLLLLRACGRRGHAGREPTPCGGPDSGGWAAGGAAQALRGGRTAASALGARSWAGSGDGRQGAAGAEVAHGARGGVASERGRGQGVAPTAHRGGRPRARARLGSVGVHGRGAQVHTRGNLQCCRGPSKQRGRGRGGG